MFAILAPYAARQCVLLLLVSFTCSSQPCLPHNMFRNHSVTNKHFIVANGCSKRQINVEHPLVLGLLHYASQFNAYISIGKARERDGGNKSFRYFRRRNKWKKTQRHRDFKKSYGPAAQEFRENYCVRKIAEDDEIPKSRCERDFLKVSGSYIPAVVVRAINPPLATT